MFLSAHLKPLAEKEDDFFALTQTFALPKINYVDIAMLEQLPHIFTHWPLLAELAAAKDSNTPPLLADNKLTKNE